MIDASRAGLKERLITAPRLRLGQILAQLQPRERLMVLGAGTVLVLTVLWLGVIDPIATAVARLEREVAQARRDASQAEDLIVRYRALRAEVDGLERGVAEAPGGAALFAQLESIAVPQVGRERITSMNPSSRAVGERFQEESVEMRLEGVSMRELVSLLQAIEHGGRPMRLVRASIKRQYKNQARLDVTLVVARLRPQ